MFLTLPAIAPEIPAVIDIAPASERCVRLALAASQHGLILDADLDGLEEAQLSSMVIHSLIEWGWHRAIGDAFDFQLLSADTQLLLPEGEETPFVSPAGKKLVGLVIHAGQPECVTIGKVFSAMEALQPGLGRAANLRLDGALSRFGCPYTPMGAFWMAQHLYWFGDEDETSALEEYGEDEEVVRRADLFAGIPEWAYCDANAENAPLSNRAFATAVRKLSGSPFGKLLADLHRLNTLNEKKWFAESPDEDPDPLVVCKWSEDDHLMRIFDDHYHCIMESGEDAWCAGNIAFEPSKAGISNALPRILHTASVLRALDDALVEIRRLENEL
jgi:PRTRC genetic system protein F